jgi:flavin-dependent dehydrogenase
LNLPSSSNRVAPVVIIGASAAGLHAACLLAQGGVPVYVFDQAQELGPPARTLIVTPRINAALGYVPSSAIVNRTPHLQLFSRNRSLTIRLSEPDLIVEREKLIRVLAQQAKAAGAELLPGYQFCGLEPDDGGVVVHLQSRAGRQEHVRTQVLIGADGALSQVAKDVHPQRRARRGIMTISAGSAPCAVSPVRPSEAPRRSDPTVQSRRDGQRMVSLLQATVALPDGAGGDTTQVWFDPPSTRFFYWLIPQSPRRAAVGLIADDAQQAQAGLQRFLSAHNLQPLEFQGAQVAPYSANGVPAATVSGARVFLIGDAGAQVKMTTVGGVVAGLRGARAAAQAILHDGGRAREAVALARELTWHSLLRQVLNRFGPSDYDDLLALVNARMQGVLGSGTRDQVGRLLWPALLGQPRLLLLAARRLLRRDGASQQE